MRHFRFLLAALTLGLAGMGASFAQATQLVFSTSPSGATSGQVFSTQPEVQAQDAAGNVITTFNGPVTLSLDPSTAQGNAVLSGTLTVNATNGVADFAGLSINQPGSYIINASANSGALKGATSVVVVVTLNYVWELNAPNGNSSPAPDATTSITGTDQVRSFVVNHNAGSPYKGTMYLPRRGTSATQTTDVFFWRGTATNPAAAAGSGTLKPAGPDLYHPDGRFSLTGITPGPNSFWAIGVADDDYVYVSGYTSTVLHRFNPDGTGGTLMTLTNSAGTAMSLPKLRQFYFTGKGIGTTMWFATDTNPPVINEWVASAVDANGGPTGFKQVLANATSDSITQTHQAVVNSTQDTFYYTGFTGGSYPTPRKYSLTGTRDTAYPVYTSSNGSGLAIDPADRLLLEAYPNSKVLVALSARNGADLTNAGDGTNMVGTAATANFPFPSDFTGAYSNHYAELSRYSARHYFLLGNDAVGGYVSTAVIGTDAPAPSVTNVHVSDSGNGGSVLISYTLPSDPEVTGVNIYRGTSSGPVSSKTKIVSNFSGATYTDTGLTNGTQYFYTVRTAATDPFSNTGYEGGTVDELSVTPTSNNAPPAAPTGLSATNLATGSRIKLTFTDPASATLDHINVYRSTAAGTLGSLIGTVAKGVQTYTDATAVNGTAFYYTVKAANGLNLESPASNQATATATDTTAPTFTGVSGFHDYGLPGLRLNWNAASDNTGPVTYKVYTATSPTGFNFNTPTATTANTTFDLAGLPLGQDVYVIVRATDAAGNTDTNTNLLVATPTRVIVDPDQNANVNADKFNPQPDTNFPALVPIGAGGSKGSTEPDLVQTGFAGGSYYLNTNDKKGKTSYTVPINTAGTYEIDAYWAPDPNANTPNYTFHLTFPDGTTQDVVLDQLGTKGGHWNALLTGKALTTGNLLVVGDATTSPDTSATDYNLSDVIRALLLVSPTNVPIYQATTAIHVDGQVTGNEWAGAPVVTLGKAFQDVIGGKFTGPADYTASVQLKYDATNLYFITQVTDDVVSFPATPDAQIYNRDGVELFLGGLREGEDPARTAYDQLGGDYQLLFSATQGATANDLTPIAYSSYTDASQLAEAVTKTATGYIIEGAIPWASLAGSTFTPALNATFGFNIVGDDNDQTSAGQDSAFSLSGKANSSANPQSFITATLLGTPPAAVMGDVDGNGVFDANDVKLLIRIVGGLAPATATAKSNGDVAGGGADGRTADGKLTLADASRLNRVLSGKDSF